MLPLAPLCTLLLLVLLGGGLPGALACKTMQSGQLVDAELNKMSPSMVPICLILNDRFLYTAEVVFDVFSRVVIKNSFAQATAGGACTRDRVWFPLGCGENYGTEIGQGVPTNFYATVQGVNSSYRKRYVQIDPLATNVVSGVLPIVTLVISVDQGVVQSVYWSDGCFFSDGREPSRECIFNAYDLGNLMDKDAYAEFLNPTSETSLGYDTRLTLAQCNQAGNPPGFCDLGIYVVWTGTSKDGKQLVSANPRFSRFRDSFAMNDQFATMVEFNGHSFEQKNETTTRSPTMRPTT